MKIRSVRPEFFADPTMADLDHAARLLYIGLWCYVDDDGRGEWLPKQIDGQIFPLEDVNIHALLEQLVRTARIVRYSDGDREYFYIPTFHEYQKPNRKYDSRLPDPAECGAVEPKPDHAVRTQRASSADAHAVEGEGEVEGVREPKGSRQQPTKPPKNANNEELAIHATFEELFGVPSDTDLGLRRKLAKSLLAADATPQEIARRAQAWKDLFPATGNRKGPTLTPTALEKHWGQLGLVAVDTEPFDPANCEHPENRRAEIEGDTYCGACGEENP